MSPRIQRFALITLITLITLVASVLITVGVSRVALRNAGKRTDEKMLVSKENVMPATAAVTVRKPSTDALTDKTSSVSKAGVMLSTVPVASVHSHAIVRRTAASDSTHVEGGSLVTAVTTVQNSSADTLTDKKTSVSNETVMVDTASGTPAQGDGIVLHAARSDSALVEGGSVVTAVFTVRNPRADTARVVPTILVPSGWAIVMGNMPFSVAPGVTDTWLVGVSVPASAPAGGYLIQGSLRDVGRTSSDSIPVRVAEHRAIEVLSLAIPGWVVAGARYEARFLVRNRGNVSSMFAFSGSTSRGTRSTTDPDSMMLAPGASTTVTVRVAMATTLARTTEDVLELTAVDRADSDVRVTTSARTTVVPSNSASRFATIPAMLSLRSIGGASGVSPVALTSAGMLADNKTSVDLAIQAPAGRQTPFGFGERDEYRADFRNDRFSLRLGDNLYGFSPLTTSGSMGTGAGLTGTLGAFSAGVYGQHLRWLPGSVSEEGVMLGTAPDSTRQLFSTFLERRSGGGQSVSGESLGGTLRLSGAASLQLEAATSDSNHTNGFAERARVSGAAGDMRYDVGVLHGDGDFAGIARGTTVQDGVVTARLSKQVTIAASGSIRESNFATPLLGIPAQRYTMANLSASYGGLATLEYVRLSRRDDGELSPFDGIQRGLRATSSLPLGPASASVSYERGTVEPADESASRAYGVLSVSAQTRLRNAGSFSVFGAHDDGNTLTGATTGVANAGVDLFLHLPFNFEVELSTSAQRATLGVFDGSGSWFSQSDARLQYRFAGGQTLALHDRVWQNPLMLGPSNVNAVYLEYGTPVRLPIGLSHDTGRAEGTIVDAETGRPLAGALVRIGDDAALTDKHGHVFFTGLAAKGQRVSVDPTGAAAGAMLVGDAFVDPSENQSRPVQFALKVARGGIVRAAVRRLGTASGMPETGQDSMVTVAPEPNVLLALTSGRDTLYQSSDDHGRADFGSVAPGTWTLTAMPGSLPDHYAFEKDRIEVTVQPGQLRDVELRLVPRARIVTFIGQDTPLNARPRPY